MAIYILIGLSLTTIEITLKSAFKFLTACLAFEILPLIFHYIIHAMFSAMRICRGRSRKQASVMFTGENSSFSMGYF